MTIDLIADAIAAESSVEVGPQRVAFVAAGPILRNGASPAAATARSAVNAIFLLGHAVDHLLAIGEAGAALALLAGDIAVDTRDLGFCPATRERFDLVAVTLAAPPSVYAALAPADHPIRLAVRAALLAALPDSGSLGGTPALELIVVPLGRTPDDTGNLDSPPSGCPRCAGRVGLLDLIGWPDRAAPIPLTNVCPDCRLGLIHLLTGRVALVSGAFIKGEN